MGKMLKYLLPFVACFVFWGSAEEEIHVAEQVCDMVFDMDACQHSLSEPDHELCLPRQISVSGPVRVQSGARRTGGVQRTSLEFTKAGKTVNAGVRYSVQNKSIISHSSMIEPCCRLISLGKLII